MQGQPKQEAPSYDLGGDSSDEQSSETDTNQPAGSSKGKGQAKQKRTSKACDGCRKSKCKCVRSVDESNNPVGPCQGCQQNNIECTFAVVSRKRGPPKGYLTHIEDRLLKLEALLGGILSNDDPRAVHLLNELIGPEQASDVLSQGIASATAAGRKAAMKDAMAAQLALQSKPVASPAVTIGFSGAGSVAASDFGVSQPTPAAFATGSSWLTDDDLKTFGGGLDPSHGAGSFTFDASAYRNTAPSIKRDSDTESLLNPSPNTNLFGGIDIPMAGSASTSGAINPLQQTSGSLPRNTPRMQSLVQSASQASNASPRQKRRLNNQSPTTASGQMLGNVSIGSAGPSGSGSVANPSTQFGFVTNTKSYLPQGTINHTGIATYHLSEDATLSPKEEDVDPTAEGKMSELADVVGQLSLNENAEVRYHGRSSGLYLISKSSRYKDFFWQFPSAGVWPPTDARIIMTEGEILKAADAEDPLPDRATQQHLLDLYWAYVHPHFPILYKVSFMRQYQYSQSNPNSTEPSMPDGSGKVPTVLLLSMFALASRYSDLDQPRQNGKYMTAGQAYFDKARRILNHDYGSSRLVTVQALLLLAYREIGTGAMSASWLFCGMAIRMAQDLGLFRDVDKWHIPVHRFTHQEKQTRKRIWWGCLIMDKYTASYIGRPGTIHERDYDTSFASEDEPEEYEQWRPLRTDGTDWASPPKADLDEDPALRAGMSGYPPTKSHTLSCFNAASALAVVVNRIIINIYAIRTRVLGQSSETLLSLLDQSLASWYLALPAHLAYNPTSKRVPPPHVLALHLQFYSALILLHRPFIPSPSTKQSPASFPSHNICTTSANAIANIVTTFNRVFTMRQCPPLLTYPIFSAAIICVYNAGFDETAQQAKVNLLKCMKALKDMEVIWGSALRQFELLHGLVDLRDADLHAELDDMMNASPATDDDPLRGVKRAAEAEPAAVPSAESQHRRNSVVRSNSSSGRASSSSRPRKSASASGRPDTHQRRTSSYMASPTIPENPLPDMSIMQSYLQSNFGSANPPVMPPVASHNFVPTPSLPQSSSNSLGVFAHDPLATAPMPPTFTDFGNMQHHTFDILGSSGPLPDLSQFKSRPGSAQGNPHGVPESFTDILNSILSPTVDHIPMLFAPPAASSAADGVSPPAGRMVDPQVPSELSFFGMPFSEMGMGMGQTPDWNAYSYSSDMFTGGDAFGQGGTSSSGNHPS